MTLIMHNHRLPIKVSIIIPTYNREQYISQAIESALSQTLADIEVIVVDDGSTDNTREVIKPYKDRIEYIYTENGGPAHARNTGMKIAKGEYIAFLDSDDLYYPYKTELQANFLDKFSDIAMVCTEFSAFDDNGFWDEYHLKKYHSAAYKNKAISYRDIYKEKYLLKNFGEKFKDWGNKNAYIGNIFNIYFENLIILTNSIMFRKEILKKVGFFNEKYFIAEEYDFALRICKHYKVGFIDVPTYKLRYHEGQISQTNRESIGVLIEKQKNVLNIAEEFGLNDKKYYLINKERINKKLAVLNKTLAVPLIAKGNEPITARMHLEKSAYYGYPEKALWLATFFPYFARRIIIKILSIAKLI